MIFLELVLENFGPYLGKQIINLNPEIDNTKRPIILFGGMNGGGKTTLMDAIRLVLYGGRAQCSKRGNLGYSEFLIQCVNSNTPPTEKARIELAFEHIVDDKITKFKVVRYWSKQDGKDTLGMLVYDDAMNEWWPDKAIANTWDEYIESLLPLGISNLFLFDGEQVKELADMDTPPDFVIGAIKSLLGLELAERLSVDLDILLSRKRKEVAGARQMDTLDKIDEDLKRIHGEMELANEEYASQKNRVEIAEKSQRLASEKFISEGGKIAGERNQLDRQLQEWKEQADKARQDMIELSAGNLPLALISPLLVQAKKRGEIEANQEQAKIVRDAMIERSDRLLNYISELSLKTKQLEQIKTFIQKENQDLEKTAAINEEPWLNADEESIAQLDNLIRYDIKAQQLIAQEKLAHLKEAETEIDFTERQLAAAASPEAYEQLEKAVKATQKELAKAKADCETARRRTEELKRERVKVVRELEKYSDEYIKMRNNQHVINSIGKVQKTLKIFKEKLTLKKLSKLENEVTSCFRYLLHKSDLVHRVIIDTNTFSLSLYDNQGQQVPKHRLSAGEKQLLAIAFLWGLARVSGRYLPVAIDTPLGRLDSSHRQNLIERYFPAASHQVILLSTDTEIGKVELENLRNQEAIAREYLLKYNSTERQTIVKEGYFW